MDGARVMRGMRVADDMSGMGGTQGVAYCGARRSTVEMTAKAFRLRIVRFKAKRCDYGIARQADGRDREGRRPRPRRVGGRDSDR